jgi:hypothetical protein
MLIGSIALPDHAGGSGLAQTNLCLLGQIIEGHSIGLASR